MLNSDSCRKMGTSECADMQIQPQSTTVGSTESFKVFVPQIVAAVVSALFHIVCGIALSYSAIIIPQLQNAHNSTNSSNEVIFVTETDNSWIASSLPVIVPVGALLSGPFMDIIGRLNVIKLAAIPSTIGWILIATATNVPMILIGRVLTGLALVWGTLPCMTYISEISCPKFRGALIALGPAFTSLGMLCGYLEGWVFHWRIVAWISLAFTIVPLISIMFIPQSPQWLVSKGRNEQATNALKWLNKYYSESPNMTETQLNELIKEHELKHGRKEEQIVLKQLKIFLRPTVYKPFLILLGLFLFQQISGIFIILFYAVTFFDGVGTHFDPFLVSVYIGLVRFAMSVATVWLMRRFGRRQLIIASGLGMSLCMCVSGLYTKWIQEGTTTQNWIPVTMLLFYIISSMVGFLGIPITIISELYPIKCRGLTQSISLGMLYVAMFAATRSYYILVKFLGGSSGLQYCFAAASITGAIYSYVFLPETHKKTLAEIEKYFEGHTLYVLYKRAQLNLDRKAHTNPA